MGVSSLKAFAGGFGLPFCLPAQEGQKVGSGPVFALLLKWPLQSRQA